MINKTVIKRDGRKKKNLALEVENVMNKINKEFNPYVEIHKNIITNKQIIIKIYNNKINL